MVDNDSKKGHNTLLCTVGAFATSHLTPTMTSCTYHQLPYIAIEGPDERSDSDLNERH